MPCFVVAIPVCLMAGGTIRSTCMGWKGRHYVPFGLAARDILLFSMQVPILTPNLIIFFQNAILGSNYARVALGLVRPKVGLLTIGTEEGKGNELIHEAHSMLKDIDGAIINYAGLIEGFQIFENVVDVVVCDGFVGNIVLKAWPESLSKLIGSFLDEELKRNALRNRSTAFDGRLLKPETTHQSRTIWRCTAIRIKSKYHKSSRFFQP